MMSAAQSGLRMLARYCGIADGYTDVWGQTHATTDETRRALLGAMRLPVDARAPDDILEELQARDGQRILPAVHVVRADAPLSIRLGVPARAARERWRWNLHTEAGRITSGEIVPAMLPLLGKWLTVTQTEVSTPDREWRHYALELPSVSETGYHRFDITTTDGALKAVMSLIVAPPTCYQPEAIRGCGRVWGLAVQLYGMRSRRNWGMGDFTDLRNLVDMTADAGGGIIGINPLHALFPDDPQHFSPYSPSNRSALNVLYIDVEATREFHECAAAQAFVAAPEFQARLRRLRAEELVDYPAVAQAKREVLELLYRHFCEQHLARDSEYARAFRQYCAERGATLEYQALFDALQAHFRATDPLVWGWPVWPEAYRDPHGPAVKAFVAAQTERVEFFAWLQWLADSQLAEVGQRSWQRGLGVGLYADLAVGANPAGAEVWAWQDVFAVGAHAGAPPERINLNGQDWGLPPFIPHRLREVAYAPLIAILRANMRHAGALRLDHAMFMTRLFWVPAGKPPSEGAYVAYPLEEMLGIVALESQRNQCLIIGEDLGTVPEGFRERLAGTDILSYRPLVEERDAEGGFLPPAEFPAQALVSFATHDMPTLAGFWLGRDLDARAALGLFPDEAQRESFVVERAQDRARLLIALAREKLLPEGVGVHPVAVPEITLPLALGVQAYLARSPARICLVQPEDILGVVEQANLPGTLDDRHPNWQRRLTLDLEEWPADRRFRAHGEVLCRERGSAVTPHTPEPTPRRTAVIPRATYRLQFNKSFTFALAAELVPYLAALGVSHVYASPYLKARPGSNHGYDIVDHAALNPEIGTVEDHERFIAALKSHGMGLILDVVPNHMGVMGADNAWWLDVLENGPAATHAAYFDIDWDPPNPRLKGKVLLPILGDHYGAVLNRGELRLEFDADHGEFSLYYWQHRLPIDPATYPKIVGWRIDRLANVLGEQDERFVELSSLLTAFSRLPDRLTVNGAAMAERQRDKEVHKRHLAALCKTCPDIAHHVHQAVTELNGRPNEPASFDALHTLIQAQGYRLAYWRVASDEINYRRFFDINDLAALRMQSPAVFEDTHRYLLQLVMQDKVDGLRIDHPDGLYDPGRYFFQLQERVGGRPPLPGEPLPLFLVIEKILAEHEQLPAHWPIHGATGYRFANLANALFVDPAAARRMTRVYEDFIGTRVDFEECVYRARKLIMETALASELTVLANRLARIAEMDRDTCDFTLNGLRDALAETAACFPVYRSYVSLAGASQDDRRHIEWAVAIAKKRSPTGDASIFDFIREVLTLDRVQGRSETYRDAVLGFAMKFQQFSAPVMAKGLEDTAFYRYHRLVSLNDVGADPRRFGISVAAYHGATRARARRWPHNLLATSTHDSKRSADVRCRIDVLSEMPAVWKLMLKRWRRINRAKKREVDGMLAPSANDEYLLYQTLIGTWPFAAAVELETYRQRIETYMIKAVREAKEHSSWINPNATYEAALSDFIAALLAFGEKNLFLTDFIPFAQRIARHGFYNSLSLTLLKFTAPGVPDIYQGCELLQFNLVDPDNRQPVDFTLRRALLSEIEELAERPGTQRTDALIAMLDDLAVGRLKLYLIHRALVLRVRWPELFRDGAYRPLVVRGERAVHVCAFARCQGERCVIAVVPRLTAKLLGPSKAHPLGESVWGDTCIELPPNLQSLEWCDELTGRQHDAATALEVGALFSTLPVALLAGPG
ncbi:malto-oligosyltrehalose synthase [Sulfuricystis multivorans]|uniref:malto-oligosyltrehalose synthase n=1 Tax=Sulfuricystis multivorans TaxID=2211108 RepID=UPI000F840416|nr:malto-oligosyltrehalose synthase [Sulfuricystis multivorans]